VENSLEGSVGVTLDCLWNRNVSVIGEIYLPIKLALLSKNGDMKGIKRIYTNPIAAGQARTFINSILNRVEVIEVASSSLAGLQAAKDRYSAAIGSKLLSDIYGLNVISENIQDAKDNLTRFFIISKKGTAGKVVDKISIAYSLKHIPGTLYKSLKPFAEKNINLTRIESRPVKFKPWEYVFFIDIEGNPYSKDVQSAIKKLENVCNVVKILGVYKKAMHKKRGGRYV